MEINCSRSSGCHDTVLWNILTFLNSFFQMVGIINKQKHVFNTDVFVQMTDIGWFLLAHWMIAHGTLMCREHFQFYPRLYFCFSSSKLLQRMLLFSLCFLSPIDKSNPVRSPDFQNFFYNSLKHLAAPQLNRVPPIKPLMTHLHLYCPHLHLPKWIEFIWLHVCVDIEGCLH